MPEHSSCLIAAPSCVIPAHIPENCRYLEPLVDEVGLCFFETRACLEYGPKELPPDLADLDLSFHIHLPLDLDWSGGGREAAEVCIRLADKADFLSPRVYVLHPPDSVGELEAFLGHWRASGFEPGRILLENIRENLRGNLWENLRENLPTTRLFNNLTIL